MLDVEGGILKNGTPRVHSKYSTCQHRVGFETYRRFNKFVGHHHQSIFSSEANSGSDSDSSDDDDCKEMNYIDISLEAYVNLLSINSTSAPSVTMLISGIAVVTQTILVCWRG